MYSDPVLSLGKGQKAFYATIANQYLNINRDYVSNFLKSQPNYQMTFKPQTTRPKRPIIANYPNEKWGCDLIDLNRYSSHNSHFRYILSVIDFFSNKCFLSKLKNKTVNDIIKGFEYIAQTQSENIYPKTLICDNGTEFEIDDFCKKHKIKLVHTQPHSPTQNAKVENQNGQIRRIMRHNFTRKNNLNWIDDIMLIVENLNNRIHSTTKQKPNDLWRPKRNKLPDVKPELLDELTKDKLIVQNQIKQKINKKAKEQMKKISKYDYDIGDTVRISIKALSSQTRKLIKEGDGKYLTLTFTPDIYKIVSIKKPKTEFQNKKYIVEDSEGEIVKEEYKINKPNKVLKPILFNGNDLLKTTIQGNLTNASITNLNKLDFRHTLETKQEKVEKIEKSEKPKPILPISRPKRNIKPNQLLNDYVK